jgi:type II secretory pathway component PulK
MKKQSAQITQNECRKNERGAALVTVLMITFLLLVAVIALLLETSMNTANVTDATAEEQAYYAAESGIQSVIKVLRGNPDAIPNPLINPSPVAIGR